VTGSRPRSDQEAAAFALPSDHLPLVIRASDVFGRTFLQCFTRVHVAGLENVPTDGPLILAANHISNADPPFMAVWLTPALGRPIHWMAKAEALDWPVAGWFMRQNGAFGIRRGAADTEAFRLAKSVLDDGRVLGAFPEGTRSGTGALQPAKDGVTLLALRTGAPILPVGVADTDRFWPRGQKLWRVGGRISMNVGEPFVLERRSGADGRKESLDDVTNRLMFRIASLLPERHRGVYAPLVAAAAAAEAPDAVPGRMADAAGMAAAAGTRDAGQGSLPDPSAEPRDPKDR
jgi:1-acyl-sn-glycerol-3-phosphate acyltransferase